MKSIPTLIWKPTIPKDPQIWKIALSIRQVSLMRTDFPLPLGLSESRSVDTCWHGLLQRVLDNGQFIRQGPWPHGVSKLANEQFMQPKLCACLRSFPGSLIYLPNNAREPMFWRRMLSVTPVGHFGIIQNFRYMGWPYYLKTTKISVIK